MSRSRKTWIIALSAMIAGQAASLPPEPDNDKSADLQATVRALEAEVVELRGLPFKTSVPAEVQSQEEFGQFLDQRISEVMPDAMSDNYGLIVRRLGLYRGELANFRQTAKSVMSSQAAAYYDPDVQRFYVLMQDGPDLIMRMLFSHELYHGLQDQHFGLEKYMPRRGSSPALDSDQMTARQSVVEGEATYIMNMWIVKQMAKKEPTRELMAPVVRMQSEMDMDAIRSMVKMPQAADLMGESMQAAMKASESIPSFIMESMMGVYLKGLAFVFAVQDQGWSEVEKLYGEYPPQSTEQILHPEKWQSREHSAITFQNLAGLSALKDWTLLASDVVGEFQWRVIFKEQGLGKEAETASAGWDGDRYAIFKHKASDATLMLLRTSWDSSAEAEEFADAYRRLLTNKYAGAPEPVRLIQEGEDVYVVEGGRKRDLAALMKGLRKTKKTKVM